MVGTMPVDGGTPVVRPPHPLQHVPIPACSPAELRPLVGAAGYREMEAALAEASAALEGRAVWHVTASEVGGMAEVLRAILGYLREGGIDVHWALLGPPRWTSITTRGTSPITASPRNSVLSASPGPEVTVKATFPA